MFGKKKRMLKLAENLRAYTKMVSNYGLLKNRLGSLKCVRKVRIQHLGYVFVDVTMDDGYLVDVSECFQVAALQSALNGVADRLEEKYG